MIRKGIQRGAPVNTQGEPFCSIRIVKKRKHDQTNKGREEEMKEQPNSDRNGQEEHYTHSPTCEEVTDQA